MNAYFPEIKKNFGFGLMRLPKVGDEVDIPELKRMVDAFIAAGFNYFDTARPYVKGKSEPAIREALTSRYPRESYLLADKLSPGFFEKAEDIRPLVDSQLEACGVDYFDFYLIHANSMERHKMFTETRAYEIALELKAEGKLRHVGFSYHDNAENLDKILTDQPDMEFVQLQFNYVDYEDPMVESRKCYEVCRKHGKPVLVMEPVRGGSLVNLPQEALDLMPGSPAGYAIRYCAGFEGIVMVLSGMSNMAQMEDNLATMTDYQPLNDEEQEMISKVRTIYQASHRIPCTSCRYCTDGCPAGIPIPEIFGYMNRLHAKEKEGEPEKDYAALEVKADACLGCGLCEEECPQHLHIRKLLKEAVKAFA